MRSWSWYASSSDGELNSTLKSSYSWNKSYRRCAFKMSAGRYGQPGVARECGEAPVPASDSILPALLSSVVSDR